MITKSLRWGDAHFWAMLGSVSIAKRKFQEVRHYPGTDLSDIMHLGKQPTLIRCQLVVFSDAERILAEQILHSEGEESLYYSNFFYKQVQTGETADFLPEDPTKTMWSASTEFIALDPIPYNITTGEALY